MNLKQFLKNWLGINKLEEDLKKNLVDTANLKVKLKRVRKATKTIKINKTKWQIINKFQT